ncbi:ROK family transcriptional regulator [Pararhizobium sp. YC-54]|uniref:ROK family transcriptional regulator n=1 Tax=Pararhizobium sp. YC-54 TaxID=2986920 RepID=UPI0021F6F443|nr:ROK family transcriptional regulator [Pararhizobium sp. YC-54]MCV9999767.1 ROK family transcriptional regulator [Pararhizobium sp. YC-54]
MNIQALSGSPRLLRNLNEKAVLQRLLSEGALTRMELEAFTGLSKPAMSDLLRRLEAASLIRRDGEKAGTYGPKAGLWTLDPKSAHVAGIDVTAHGIDVAIADISSETIATFNLSCDPGQRYDAHQMLVAAIEGAARSARLTVADIDQLVVGLPGIVDLKAGNLRKGQQLPNWQGYHIPEALESVLGHRRVLIENDVNLVAIEEMACGAAKGVQSFILFWVGDGVGAGVVIGGSLIHGSTGTAGELGGAMVPDRYARPGEPVCMALLDDLLDAAAVDALVARHGLSGAGSDEAIRIAAQNNSHPEFFAELSYRCAAGLTGAIGALDPEMVVLGGPVGGAGGRILAQGVSAILATLPIAIPQIVPTKVSSHAVRAGAVELALQHTRERVFTGGSAARGLP